MANVRLDVDQLEATAHARRCRLGRTRGEKGQRRVEIGSSVRRGGGVGWAVRLVSDGFGGAWARCTLRVAIFDPWVRVYALICIYYLVRCLKYVHVFFVCVISRGQHYSDLLLYKHRARANKCYSKDSKTAKNKKGLSLQNKVRLQTSEVGEII